MLQNSLAGIFGNCASLHQLCFLSIRTHCVGLSNSQIPNHQGVRPRPPLPRPAAAAYCPIITGCHS